MLRPALLLALPVLLLGAAPAAKKPEQICGWLANPTPGNWWITDREREWTLSTQGGPQAPGWEDVAYDPSAHEYVKTNGEYGYGCACARMTVNHRTGEIIRIYDVTARRLKQCRADRKLGRP